MLLIVRELWHRFGESDPPSLDASHVCAKSDVADFVSDGFPDHVGAFTFHGRTLRSLDGFYEPLSGPFGVRCNDEVSPTQDALSRFFLDCRLVKRS